MRKQSLIALFVCGCLFWSFSLAAADWIWNPFKNRSEKSSDQTIPIRTSNASASPDPFLNASLRRESTGQISLQSHEQPAETTGPISNDTYRLILEESRNYPADVRQNFVRGFSRLTDAEARKRIERIRRARAERAPAGSSTVAVRDYSSDTSWEQLSYEQAAGKSEVKPEQPTLGIASTTTTLPEWSQFAQQMPGHSSTTQPATAMVRKVAEPYPNPFGAEDPFANQVPAAGTAREYGMARVPGETPAAFSGPRISPAGHSSTQHLPVIRPANTDNDQSHYASHYSPVAQEQIKAAATERPYDESRAVSQAPAAPVAATSGDDQNVEILIARMEALAAQSQPGSTEASLQQHVTKHVELRLLYLITDEKDRALTAIPGLSRDEQIFWTRVFWGLTNYLDQSSTYSKAERTTVALDQLRNAIQSLQGDAGLQIRHTEFCSEIENFGNYTRYDRDEFSPGQEVLLYCELENFQSEELDGGIYRTLLKSSIQIRKPGADGQVIDQVPYNPTEDLCRSRRKDFMQGFKYRLPRNLSAGSYVMEIVIEDQLSGKSAQSSLNFAVK